jgi:hypothetical protein
VQRVASRGDADRGAARTDTHLSDEKAAILPGDHFRGTPEVCREFREAESRGDEYKQRSVTGMPGGARGRREHVGELALRLRVDQRKSSRMHALFLSM